MSSTWSYFPSPGYNPEIATLHSKFISMNDCMSQHKKFPEFTFEDLRGGACPSTWQFKRYYRRFLRQNNKSQEDHKKFYDALTLE